MSVVVVSSANNNFGLDLLGNIMDGNVLVSKYCPMLVFMIYCVRTQENVLLSPYSASLALLMAAAGARDETRSQMLAGLRIQDQDTSDCWQSSFPYIRDDGFYDYLQS